MPLSSAPNFTARVPIQFLSADAPTLSITGANVLLNNPSSLKILTGTFAKMDYDIDGMSHLRGDAEAPPFAIQIEWKILGYNDYVKLAALRPYYVTFITYRNIGYYGKLVMDGPEAIPGSADVVTAKGTFYPISPSDSGGAVSVNRITAPAALTIVQGAASSGYIPTGITTYYWITFASAYGETTAYAGSIAQTNANCKNTLTWTWPGATNYCEYATIYCAAVSSGAASLFAASVPNGLTAQWIDYVGYSGLTVPQAIPTTNIAYRGAWQAGIWYNET